MTVERSEEPLLKSFCGDDWPEVLCAEKELESRGSLSIPALIRLCGDDHRVPLRNTADLIYPGAGTYSGHGRWCPYHLDIIGYRAGWALEEITFCDFGFRAAFQPGESGPPPRPDGRKALEDQLKKSAAEADAWWQRNGDSWRRLSGIQEAINSGNPDRQVRAMAYLRLGDVRCNELTPTVYSQRILPAVRKLLKSNNEAVAHQADLLVNRGPAKAILDEAVGSTD
ncbi:MAG TPA: hypothetical protein PLP01_14075 [Phycisphaerae bacterium]|nr:hypothetical protein [Phycisphaerae bacterium]